MSVQQLPPQVKKELRNHLLQKVAHRPQVQPNNWNQQKLRHLPMSYLNKTNRLKSMKMEIHLKLHGYHIIQ